jgi:uncharacterized membrane protein YphA (DoxX/SURF4 family)
MPGIGLLLLRVAVGVIATLQGAGYFLDRNNLTLWMSIAGLLAILGGGLLIVGLLTPIAGGLVAFQTAGHALAWFPIPSPNLLDTMSATALVGVVALAVALLGPGALSVDARLFGRREIIIPYNPKTSKAD